MASKRRWQVERERCCTAERALQGKVALARSLEYNIAHPQDKAQKFVIIDEISIENVIIKWPGRYLVL